MSVATDDNGRSGRQHWDIDERDDTMPHFLMIGMLFAALITVLTGISNLHGGFLNITIHLDGQAVPVSPVSLVWPGVGALAALGIRAHIRNAALRIAALLLIPAIFILLYLIVGPPASIRWI